MAPLGPPEPGRRRLWLWLTLGMIGACVFCCVVFLVWGATLGKGDLQHFGTYVAKRATEAAHPPTPTR